MGEDDPNAGARDGGAPGGPQQWQRPGQGQTPPPPSSQGPDPGRGGGPEWRGVPAGVGAPPPGLPPPGAPQYASPEPHGTWQSSPAGPPATAGDLTGSFDEGRPRPRFPNVLAAAAGLLVMSSLLLLVSQLPEDNRRVTGLLLSLAFLALGVITVLVWRDRPAASAGVVVSALGVLPVLVFAFIDPNKPDVAFGSFDRGKGTLTGILAVSAGLWLVAYLVGPARRFAFYLGAALIAVWLLLLLQIATTALDRVTSTGFGFDSGSSDSSGDSTFGTVSSTTTRIGIVSLVVGLIYLVVGRLLDRRGGTRAGTPFFATTVVILTVATLALINPWKPEGASLLAIALGGALIWLGTPRGRRFTSWYGAFAVAAGVFALINKLIDKNVTAAGLVVLVAGAAIALVANLLTDRADPTDEVETMTPLPAWSPPPGGP